MKKIRDDIWLCTDCLFVAVNGDATGLDYHYQPDEAAARLTAIETGLTRLGANLVPDFDSETGKGVETEIGAWCTKCPCQCCGDKHHGSRHRFAVLGPEDYEACGDCGFDHSYEQEEAVKAHRSMGT